MSDLGFPLSEPVPSDVDPTTGEVAETPEVLFDESIEFDANTLKAQVAGKANLAKKLATVMGEVNRIPKRGWNDFHKYKFVTESDLADALRKLLSDVGVFILSTVDSVEEFYRESPKGPKLFTRVWMTHRFIDGDSGEELVSRFCGLGEDNGDKGPYKAYTGAMKYMLIKTFLVSTGDDPELSPNGSPSKRGNEFFGKQAQQPRQGANASRPTPTSTSATKTTPAPAPAKETGDQGDSHNASTERDAAVTILFRKFRDRFGTDRAVIEEKLTAMSEATLGKAHSSFKEMTLDELVALTEAFDKPEKAN